jgi:hypothetical protein
MSPSTLRRLILGGILAGMTGYGLWQLRGGPDSAAAQNSSPESSPEPDEADPLAATLQLSEEHQRERAALTAAAWPPDPFRRLEQTGSLRLLRPEPTEARQTGALILSGIISGSSPLAMIDGRVVTVGDRLGQGAVVITIDDDSVTLQTPKGTRILRLPD